VAKKKKKRTVARVGTKKKSYAKTTGFDLSMHNLGEISTESLVKEANIAVGLLRNAVEAFGSGDEARTMDLLFKSAAVAVNVIFTSRVNGIPLPEKVHLAMVRVSQDATKGIAKLSKVIARQRIRRHEDAFHSRQKKGVSRKRFQPGKVASAKRMCR
jgi:sensor histidine kinase regulating citrate/malate metabolism